MNVAAHESVASQLAHFVVAPVVAGNAGSPPQAPPEGSGERGEALVQAAQAVAAAWPELPEGTSPAHARLLRNREARRAADAVDRVISAFRGRIPASDIRRLRRVANALSLGWEEVEQFLVRDAT